MSVFVHYISSLFSFDSRLHLNTDFQIKLQLRLLNTSNFTPPTNGNHATGNHTTGNHTTGNHMTGNRTTGNHTPGNHTPENHMTGNRMTRNRMTWNQKLYIGPMGK